MASAPTSNDVIVSQPSAFTGEAAAISRAPLSVLKDQMLVRSIDGYASYLPKAFDQERFHFYGTVLSGTPEQEARWKRAVNFTVGTMGDDVSKLYVAKYFPPETKAAADKLVHNIIGAMDRRIDKLEWMSPETKAKAHAKLAAFTPKIGYPSQWRDMSGLVIDRNDLLGNAMRSNKFDHAYEIGKLGGPIRRWEWGMTPMTINAYANFGNGRDRVPRGDPAAALLRSECRPGDQLWRHRRGDRARAQPSFRRPGRQIRPHRQADRLVDARRFQAVHRAARQI